MLKELGSQDVCESVKLTAGRSCRNTNLLCVDGCALIDSPWKKKPLVVKRNCGGVLTFKFQQIVRMTLDF